MKQVCVVTGASGFIGRSLTSQLRLNPQINLHQLNNSIKKSDQQDYPKVDLQNLESVKKFISEVRPDKIFHLASKSSVVDSWRSPTETILYNYEITNNIVKAINEISPMTRLIYFSSSAVYARKNSSISETDDLGPDSPYGISKLISEMSVETLSNYLILRPFFIIGPGKKNDVIYDWFKQISETPSNKDIELQVGNLGVVRDFMSCTDATKLIIELEKKIQSSEIYNICSGEETYLKDLMKVFLEIVPSITKVVENSDVKYRFRDRTYVVGNPSRLLEAQIKVPKLDLRNLLKETYSNWQSGR
jgi:GDP-4-dehydro-6-deoxy-D-mannose reductase